MNQTLNESPEATPEGTEKLHIAVVGGGPGGYAAAFLAADLGMQVTLIDPELNPGGVCLYRGCIPSKALLHVAKLIEESRQAKNWGIEFPAPTIDLAKPPRPQVHRIPSVSSVRSLPSGIELIKDLIPLATSFSVQ